MIREMDVYFGGDYKDIDKIPNNYYEYVKEEFGMRQIRHSAIADIVTENILRSFLQNVNHAVEIGTFYGTATALLAHYADRVVTMDIIQRDAAPNLWLYCGVINKISYYIIENEEDKKKLIEELGDFDFAFVDGNHREGVFTDFELVKKCGRVLFHDYFNKEDMKNIAGLKEEWGAKPSSYIVQLVDSLPKEEVTIKKPFALWNIRK